MYGRMLDKNKKPTMDEFISYIGENGHLFIKLNEYLTSTLGLKALLRFPYGNHYGWGVKYSVKNKHICDVFAENNAFTVMIRLTDKQFQGVYSNVTDGTKKLIDNKYPCGEGGWIHLRVLTENSDLADVITIIQAKL